MSYLLKVIQKLKDLEQTGIPEKLSESLADRIQAGGIIYMFGCGHSGLLAQDAFYRAGGLVPVKPIFIEPLMLHQGALQSSSNERTDGFVLSYLEQETITEKDVMVVFSTSGRNPAPIDAAMFAKEAGAFVLSIQSLYYTSSQESRHVSGKRLEDVVDAVVDSMVPVGDAVEERENLDTKFGPVSSVLGSALLHYLMANVMDVLLARGMEPPIFKSGNVDGADDHNSRLIEKYKGRISF
ncbi:SIS domain-containing protein [Halobacillus sp. BAB-2008]|uniref:sugar isomerase domain-containing protein n=1 Tax=Halobacillus sp. BAB-2008 TaxID=1246484 RepID=UPI0002A50BB1|nr:SIS domain-containing protein [Halobacillus sp. BAB-2008]ELK44455.1 hypothetical protein D479_19249 [Halobacillus sp. BAB-2008]